VLTPDYGKRDLHSWAQVSDSNDRTDQYKRKRINMEKSTKKGHVSKDQFALRSERSAKILESVD
jgi:hypothetical protein